eukprot:889011_1
MDIQAIVLEAMTSIAPVIQGNTLVDLKACKTVPQSKDAYRKVARNRLNRQKPKFIGNFVFAPLLFYRLYQFCRRMFAENGVIAFVSVLSDVLCPQSVIRFEQTRAQPLIPYNTLAMDNAFRSSCLMLLKHYDLEKDWSNANKKKSSAKDKWHHFITHSIPKLTQRCCWPQYKAPQCLFIPQNSTGKFTTTVPLIPPSDIPQCVQRPSKPDTPMHNTYRHPRNNEEQSGSYIAVCAVPHSETPQPKPQYCVPYVPPNNSTQNDVFGYPQNHINQIPFCNGSVSCNNDNNYGMNHCTLRNNERNIPAIPFTPPDHNMSLQRQTNNRNVDSHSIHNHQTNNIGSFNDGALYGSNRIVDDAVIEAGTIYTNDCSDYLQHMEHKIENHNTYYNQYSDTEEDEMDDYDLTDNDEYVPKLVNKFDRPQKPKHVQSSPETQDVSEIECGILSESSMDSDHDRLALQLEYEMNIYDEQMDGLYEKITTHDLKEDQAVEKGDDTDTQTNNGLYNYNHAGIRKLHRYRPGTVALRQIRRYQKSAKFLISKNEFERCIGSMVYAQYPHNVKFQQSAIYALQQGVEQFIVDVFRDSNLCALHSKRINICPKDIQLASRLRQKANIDRHYT